MEPERRHAHLSTSGGKASRCLKTCARKRCGPTKSCSSTARPGGARREEGHRSHCRNDAFAVRYVRSGAAALLAKRRHRSGERRSDRPSRRRRSPGAIRPHRGRVSRDRERRIGGVVGYRRANRHFQAADAKRWQWYPPRLNLLTTYEPGRYDFETGYPINANRSRLRRRARDFMSDGLRRLAARGVRRGAALRYFRDYGDSKTPDFPARRPRVALTVRRRCLPHFHPHGPRRSPQRSAGASNYYYVFRTWRGRSDSGGNGASGATRPSEFLRIAASRAHPPPPRTICWNRWGARGVAALFDDAAMGRRGDAANTRARRVAVSPRPQKSHVDFPYETPRHFL